MNADWRSQNYPRICRDNWWQCILHMILCLMALHLKNVHSNPKARTEWAVQQLKYAAKASQNLGLNAHATFSGALLWHTVYPWPQRPAGLVETGFTELANAGCLS